MKIKLELPDNIYPSKYLMLAIATMEKKRLDFENDMLDKILRNFVTPPIKGEITKGKVKWRGLCIARYKGNLIGIIQRDKLITADGIKVPFVNGVLQDLSVLKTWNEIYGTL